MFFRSDRSLSMMQGTMNRRPRAASVAMVFALMVAGSALAQAKAAPRADQEVHQFVEKLLGSMSAEEKIGQLEQAAGQYTPAATAEALASKGQVGSFLFFTDPVRINALQKLAVTQSPHHLPLLFGHDVIPCFRTINPVPIALASACNQELVQSSDAMP